MAQTQDKPNPHFTKLGSFLKQNLRWLVFLLLLLVMTLHFRDIYLVPAESNPPMTWLGFGLGGLINLSAKWYKKEPLSRFLIYTTITSLTMSANYLLFRAGIPVPGYVVFILITGTLLLVDIFQREESHLLLKAGIVLLSVALFFAVDYEQYQDRLLKDHRFDRHIRHTFELEAPLTAEDLAEIEGFSISRFNNVSRLDGLQHFINLTRLYLWDASMVEGLTLVADLPRLETLMLAGARLDTVNDMPPIPTLTTLEVVYPDKGRLKTLAHFPNLEELDLQGVHAPLHYEGLSHLNLPDSIQVLGIADTPVFSLREAAHLPRLHHLRFYEVHLEDVDQLAFMEQLDYIRLQRTVFDNASLFHELVQQHGIRLEDLDARDEMIIQLH